MDRQRLEDLSIAELQEEVRNYNLIPKSSRDELIDQIMSYLERYGPLSDSQFSQINIPHDSPAEFSPPILPAHHSANGLQPGCADGNMSQICAMFAEMFKQQQQQQLDMMQKIFSSFPHGQMMSSPPATDQVFSRRFNPVPSVPARGSLFNTVSPGQAVKLLSSQLPEFCGSEDDDVDRWITKVEQVSRIHGVPSDVTLLAASSKLVKAARRWFDLNTGTVNDSWDTFKLALVSRFQRNTLYPVLIQKVEARKWNSVKESFHDYAMDKIALMHNLYLSDRDAIHFLVSGITNTAIRSTAAALPADNMDVFLKRMHDVTYSYTDFHRRFPIPINKSEKEKLKPLEYSERNLNTGKISKDLFCVYCKNKGHVRTDCWKLKRKESSQSSTVSSSSSTVAAAEETIQDDSPLTSKPAPVACAVAKYNNKLEISDTRVRITSLNNISCDLIALIDTGSPCSFVSFSLFQRYFNCSSVTPSTSKRTFIGLNNLPIPILGTISTPITFELLPNFIGNISLQILNNNSFPVEIVVGRDFFQQHNILVVYNPTINMSDNNLELIQQVASADILIESENDVKSQFNEIEIDFDEKIKKDLISVLTEVDNTHVDPIDDGYAVKVSLKDDSVYAYAPRRFAWSERIQIRNITDDLLKRGIIKHSISPYCARVVPARKRDGSIRLCADLRPLNDRVYKQKYPFPLIEDHLARLSNKNIFSSIDLKDGFHNIRVHPDHTKYFAFATPDGQFEYLRLPFGYCEAPAEFQKRLIHVLQPLISEDRVLVYIDDILIPSETVDDNLCTLKEVLLLLKRYEMHVNLKKCFFLKKSIEYLGYNISAFGITLSSRHVNSIKSFPQPTTVQELQRFLGLTNYFRKFIYDYASIAKPLQMLLRKSVKFVFDDDCCAAFNSLKDKLTTYPVLRLFNPKADSELHTDASSIAVAGILLQRQIDSKWAPIAYFSQATNQAESKYHSFELEMLAVVKSIERFHIYLYGLDFTVVTDCHALVYAVNKAHLNPRIARWTLRLQNYNFKVVHRSGQRMKHVDALSRIAGYVHSLPLERELEYKQLLDPRLKVIAENLEFSDNDKFELIDGLVFRKCLDKPRFVVPESMVTNIIRVYHDEMAHCGVEKTFQGIGSNYWFPSMRRRICAHIDECLTCLVANNSVNIREGELSSFDNPTAPLQIVHCDHFGPLTETSNGFKHVLVLIDAFTRFTWLFPVKSTTSKETIKNLSSVFNVFGYPSTLVSDRGTAFTSREFSEFLNGKNSKHRQVAVAAPWSNGLVERINRFLKSSLKKVATEPSTWNHDLDLIQYVINNTFHSSLKASPSKLLLGYEQRNHSDAELIRSLSQLLKTEYNCDKNRNESLKIAMEVSDKIRNYNKVYYDKRHKKPTKYKVGDFVMVRDTTLKPGEDKKLKANYKAGYVIAKVLDNNRYVVKDIPGFNVSSKSYNTILSSDRLKLWIKPIPKPTIN